jgi:hypothetical protein
VKPEFESGAVHQLDARDQWVGQGAKHAKHQSPLARLPLDFRRERFVTTLLKRWHTQRAKVFVVAL